MSTPTINISRAFQASMFIVAYRKMCALINHFNRKTCSSNCAVSQLLSSGNSEMHKIKQIEVKSFSDCSWFPKTGQLKIEENCLVFFQPSSSIRFLFLADGEEPDMSDCVVAHLPKYLTGCGILGAPLTSHQQGVSTHSHWMPPHTPHTILCKP